MANKTKLGKIRKNVQGFDIREMLEDGKSNGRIGLYKGKNLAGTHFIYKANDFGIADATREANTLAESSRRSNKKEDDYLRRTNPVRVKNTTKKETGKKAYLERMKSK